MCCDAKLRTWCVRKSGRTFWPTISSARKEGIEPRSISFKGAAQTLAAFQPIIAIQGNRDPSFRWSLYQELLTAIAIHRVADRPDRFEPRLRKRRPKHYAFLRKPRHVIKREMVNGFGEI